MNKEHIEQAYAGLRKLVLSNKRSSINSKVRQLCVSYEDREDLVQDLIIELMQCDNPPEDLYIWTYNSIYNLLRRSNRRKILEPEIVSYDELMEKGIDPASIMVDNPEPSNYIDAFDNEDLYEEVVNEHLTDIDRRVLQGIMSRKEAAAKLGLNYDTYQRSLHRKITEIRKKFVKN
jgi:RNA polymerase sigma factor (sigma-70 family)